MTKNFSALNLWWQQKKRVRAQSDKSLALYYRHWGLELPTTYIRPALWVRIASYLIEHTSGLVKKILSLMFTLFLSLVTGFSDAKEFCRSIGML